MIGEGRTVKDRDGNDVKVGDRVVGVGFYIVIVEGFTPTGQVKYSGGRLIDFVKVFKQYE